MYRKYINSESIQKNLVDALRKGQTILPAIECYNSIEEHLLSIDYILLAGRVLLDYLKVPKNFTYCRYPLMLCCLVAEFMGKLKRKFPVYESTFDQIDRGFKKAGELFASKIKDLEVIQFHLSRKDIKNRNCLQIMAQNRLYPMLKADYVGNIINRNWSGKTILYGLNDMSSFTYMMRYNLEDDMFHFRNFSRKYNLQKSFYSNYYSYIEVPSIRYYFKESYGFILIVLYQVLIYLCVVDKNLENSINKKYYTLSRVIYFLSLGQAFDKINSMIFFTFVPRWYIEMDPFLLWLSFAAVIFVHWFDLKSCFIKGESERDFKNKELINAILLSYQFAFLWIKILDSFKATQTYGGFLRTIEVIFRKMFLVMVFFYCFILLMTGVFNLLFQQTLQFQSYFDSFFYLAQAAQQQYEIGDRWNMFVKFALIIYMGVCTLVLINLIITLATRIYDEASDDVLPEHRANLVKLYEYLRWDDNYGLFKFLFAPLNVFQFPFSIFILIPKNKEYWTKMFTKILFVFVALVFFIGFLIVQCVRLPISLFHFVVVQPFKYGTSLKRFMLHLVGCPFFFTYYFIRDIENFWYYSFRVQFEVNDDEDKSTNEIVEFKQTFTNLISVVSNRVESDKKCKRFWIPELLNSWLTVISQTSKGTSKIEFVNRMHKKSILARKRKVVSGFEGMKQLQKKPMANNIYKMDELNTISISEQFKRNFEFLFRFADKEGFIDKDVAKNIFPKKNYYDDDYFEFIYYYSFKYFKSIISHFTKMTNEIKKDMNKLRGVYMDFLKINEKFKNLKIYLKTHKFSNEEINTLAFGITNINTVFAGLENHLNDAQAKELYEKISKQSSSNAKKKAQTSSLQNQNPNMREDDKIASQDYAGDKKNN